MGRKIQLSFTFKISESQDVGTRIERQSGGGFPDWVDVLKQTGNKLLNHALAPSTMAA